MFSVPVKVFSKQVWTIRLESGDKAKGCEKEYSFQPVCGVVTLSEVTVVKFDGAAKAVLTAVSDVCASPIDQLEFGLERTVPTLKAIDVRNTVPGTGISCRRISIWCFDPLTL